MSYDGTRGYNVIDRKELHEMDKSSRLSSFANNGFVMFSYINVENEYDLREWNMLFWEIFSQTFSHNLVKRYVRNLVSFDFWSYRFLEVSFIFPSMIFNELMHVNTLKKVLGSICIEIALVKAYLQKSV